MTRQLLYLIGPPGAGKTTALEAALDGVRRVQLQEPFAHQVCPAYADNGVGKVRGFVLGRQREGFGGTDALPMNVQPKVEAWLSTDLAEGAPVVAEGDRLGNDKFFKAARAAGWDLTVVCLVVPNEVLEARRFARGSLQNPTWAKGRQTKVERLAAKWVHSHWMIDGCAPVETVVARLRRHPVVRALRGEV